MKNNNTQEFILVPVKEYDKIRGDSHLELWDLLRASKRIEMPKECSHTNVYYQPEINIDGNITGHEDQCIFSFEVWRSRKNLLIDWPNCKPIKYSGDDIEEPTFND